MIDINDLIKNIANICLKKNVTISVAESCTGGLLAAALTSMPGASNWFDYGVVTYSNNSKIKLLGVKKKTIAQYGAVSEETAQEMALGILQNVQNKFNLGLSITGIAGPDGGTSQKPVGTICFASVVKKNTILSSKTETKLFPKDMLRHDIRNNAVLHAVKTIIIMLEKI